MIMKLERTVIEKCSVAEADKASGWQGWIGRPPRERMHALESLRLLRIPRLHDGSLPRLQRVLAVVRRGGR